jgi:uncharacterized RDD family membrane protein YckC
MAEETWRYVLRVDGRDIELLDGEVTLGRSRTATVRVDHESVSRTHAMLTFRKGDAVVKDLNSSNGTYVGGRRVLNETRLADGDRIQLGAAVVGFKVVAPSGPADRTSLIGSELSPSAPPPATTPEGPIKSAPEPPPTPALATPRAAETIEAPPSPRASTLPPPPPPPDPIPFEQSAEAAIVAAIEAEPEPPPKKSSLDAAAELAAAAKEAMRLSPPATTPSTPQQAAVSPPAPLPPPAPPPVPGAPVSAPRAMPPPPPSTGPRPQAPRSGAPELSRVPIRDDDRPMRAGVSEPVTAERAIPDNVAGFLPRLAAYLVDSVILLALNLIFLSPVLLIYFFRPELKAREAGSDWTLFLIGGLCVLLIVVANFWYTVGGWAKGGRTPGKALLGLHIVRGDRRSSGGGLGWRTAIVRAIGYVLSSLALSIGFLVVLFRKDRRAWHDLIADTWVVWRK